MKPASGRNSLRRAQPHLGTLVEIETDGGSEGARGRETQAAIDAAFAAIARVHRLMTFHAAESDVGRLNRAAPDRAVTVDPWTWQVIETALALHRDSGGAFDVAVGATLQRLGRLPPDDSAPPDRPAEPRGCQALELLENRQARIRCPGLRVDLGGIAKGFAVDRAVDVLRSHGIVGGLVNAGGDLRVFGPVARRVHIRDPRRPDAMLGAIELADGALASSTVATGLLDAAGLVIDPGRRRPVSAVLGASVRAASCLIADSLTKVVMVSGQAAAPLLAQHQASALLISTTGEIFQTPDWPAAAPAPPRARDAARHAGLAL